MTYSTLTLSLDQIAENYRQLQMLSPNQRVLAVLKANAYGLGALPIASALHQAGCRAFGLAHLDEIAQLRHAGITGQMMLFTPITPDDAENVLENDATVASIDSDSLAALSRTARRRGRPAQVVVKVDTGMGRYGATPDAALKLIEEAANDDALTYQGWMTHFATADEPDSLVFQDQQREIARLERALVDANLPRHCHSTANSAVLYFGRPSQGEYVRPGIGLYGCQPGPSCVVPEGFQLPLHWETSIRQLKWVPKGTGLSYGHAFVTERRTQVATVPVGYADGVPRSAANRGHMLVDGVVAPILGRPAMDHTLLDVSSIASVSLASQVVIVSDSLPPWHWGRVSGRLDYEILTGISPRVERVYARAPAGFVEAASL